MTEARNPDTQPPLSKTEHIKIASNGLYGGIQEGLESPDDRFPEEDTQLLKAHGTYQQDNRDVRSERRKAKLDRDYKFMVRTKVPGGRLTAEQYLLCDDLADKYGQQDLRITSRQGFQFHGVAKRNLRALIHDLNRFQNISTQGACGDVVRNVMASPVADIDPAFADSGVDLLALARQISDRFLPQSGSYFDIWLDDELVAIAPDGTIHYREKGPRKPVVEPIYGRQYLPRKFKIGLMLDIDNSIDVYTQDVGIMGLTESGRAFGFEVLIGGGLGYSHGKAGTYARLGTPLTCVPASELPAVVEGVVKFQRDNGNRSDRHQARLKYTVDRLGMDKAREIVGGHAGMLLPPPTGRRPLEQPDYLGWHRQSQPGLNYVGIWVENGRIRDFESGIAFRTALRRIVETFRPSVRLTPHHNIILANFKDADVPAVQAIIDEHKLPLERTIEIVRRHEMACPALPLCGLALAESERAMPKIMSRLIELGHADDDVVIRMTGCPNSCARPETAEIGVVGRGPDKYNLYVGGDRLGTRMNTLLLENVTTDEVPVRIAALLTAWRAARSNGEDFGDWANAKGNDALTAIAGSAS